MKKLITLLLALVLVLTFVPAFSIEAEALNLEEVNSQYYIVYSANGGGGSVSNSGPYSKGDTAMLASGGFTRTGYTLAGWRINGSDYPLGGSIACNETNFSSNGTQYYATASAIWSNGSSTTTSSNNGETYTVTYRPGEGKGSAKTQTLKKDEPLTLIANPFTHESAQFKGWEYGGTTYDAGTKFNAPNVNIEFTAVWGSSGVTVIDPNASSSSSSSSKSSTSSSKSSSSSSSKSSTSSSKSSSSSSVSETSAETSSVPESVSSSSVPEVYEPETLAYSITGDIPVTKIEFLIKEDLGGTAQLAIASIDNYSVTDPAAKAFIDSGDALAAFDVSLLVNGLAYSGEAPGTFTYQLNGTQTTAQSNYKAYVLAMVHTVAASSHSGEYYITEEGKTYLYNPTADFKTEAENVILVQEEGYNRLVIKDVSGLSSFAYEAAEGIIGEVNLVASDAAYASIEISSFSPIILAQIEVGEGKAAGSGFAIPFWIWIVIGVVVIVIGALVALFLIGRNSSKNSYSEERTSVQSASSGITGFDDDDDF